jgi:hypothetical protein
MVKNLMAKQNICNQRYIEPELPTPFWKKLFDLDEIESLLQASAKEGKALSYAETLNCLGLDFSRPKMRALCVALSEIDRRAKQRRQPELAVLVVRASDKIPGAGWWQGRKDPGYDGEWEGPKALEHIRRIQGKAFAYWGKRKNE